MHAERGGGSTLVSIAMVSIAMVSIAERGGGSTSHGEAVHLGQYSQVSMAIVSRAPPMERPCTRIFSLAVRCVCERNLSPASASRYKLSSDGHLVRARARVRARVG